MQYFCDLRIGDIGIIVKKEEKEGFVFHNPARFASGFVCFLSGKGEINIDGVGRFPIEAGSFIRYEKGDSYTIHVPTPCVYVVSDMEIDLRTPEGFPRATTCTAGEMAALERLVRVFDEQDEYCYVESRILALRFFSELSKRLRAHLGPYSERVSAALAYIHKRYNENFTLEELSLACNVSPSYLRACFSRELGKSVMQYREELRVRRAKAMLRSGEFRIKEIAAMLGYCDVYHFSRAFKREVGVPPGQYAQGT
ncbi:MAG: AraC family transcriptional regulator [Clostridia bacterium]|nr:AraC family transcriptional regulator [Clostridia bacterium]